MVASLAPQLSINEFWWESRTFVKIDMIQVKKEPKYSIVPGLGSNSCKSGINIGELYILYTHTWDKYCIYFTWTTKINIDSRNMGSTPAKCAAKSVKGKQNWKYVNKIVNGCRFDWWKNGGKKIVLDCPFNIPKSFHLII